MAKVVEKRKLGRHVSGLFLGAHFEIERAYIIIASKVCFTAIEIPVRPTLNLAEPPVPDEVALPSRTIKTSLASNVLF
jgi:hypothetical protein